MVRRRIAVGVGVVALIVIVLVVDGCLKGQRAQALRTYNQDVNQISQESEQQISNPFFSTLAGTPGQSAISVSEHINQLKLKAEELAKRAEGLSVPSEMTEAQRNLLLALDLRAEGLMKVATLISAELGTQAKQASTKIAGDMEIFLGSDVIFAQRVVPLIETGLHAGGVTGLSTSSSRFLPNLGWLEPEKVLSRIGGQSSGETGSGEVSPGTHGHALTGVSVGETALSAQPVINHISAGTNPTFTVMLQNSGENTETNVKVDVEVEGGEKKIKVTRTINKTEPGQSTSVDIPVQGVALGVASRVTVFIHPVPGETDVENNKGVFIADFEH
jgi:hypothetical protein